MRVGGAPGPGCYDLSTRTTGSPARSAGWPPTAGASRSCTPCTPWPGSRTSTSPTATAPSRSGREIGEAQVVEAADRLVANTDGGGRASSSSSTTPIPAKVRVVAPGRRPRRLHARRPARRPGPRSACRDARVLLFVGRIQPLKAPDVLLRGRRRAAAPATRPARRAARRRRPRRAQRLRPAQPRRASRSSPPSSASPTSVRFVPPVARPALAQWYRAADLVVVPSYSESFGLVALEAQACGTPVVAAAVGGLPTAVGDSGVLVDGHDTGDLDATPSTRCWSTPRGAAASAARRRARPGVRLGGDRRPPARGLRRGRAGPGPPRRGRPVDEAGQAAGGPDRRDPVSPGPPQPTAEATVRAYLDDAGIEWEPGGRAGEFVVTLPGRRS